MNLGREQELHRQAPAAHAAHDLLEYPGQIPLLPRRGNRLIADFALRTHPAKEVFVVALDRVPDVGVGAELVHLMVERKTF